MKPFVKIKVWGLSSALQTRPLCCHHSPISSPHWGRGRDPLCYTCTHSPLIAWDRLTCLEAGLLSDAVSLDICPGPCPLPPCTPKLC
ncbi:hypothetical protein AAFF_G00226760 [Aldrovandia affinis]|uniref:Uncharacterized protein n=1 Tax=Aldrovandia affinis TaxID=143900 RepID=A0AAD7TBQ1_9TELE|nr:hypothetical protein AAFF_G00226760 [Aldrovandia affinis]